MNYKETVFFIGKCLTINHEEHNRVLVEEQLKSNTVDWDNVVRISTGHFVFPALYCNLKRANFLHYLPQDLVEYMAHITQLNRERNEELIAQAREVNKLFLANNIKPIFLKGTAFLAHDLYDDIAERMVGDIDFIVPFNDFEKAIDVAQKDGYICDDEYKLLTTFKNNHYPKIVKEGAIGALEIHYRVTRGKYENSFNYEVLSQNTITKNGITSLSAENHILMTCFNKQISDSGYLFESITLRNAYDLFLLSKKASPLKTIKKFGHHFDVLNGFLASTNWVFNNSKSVDFEDTKKVQQLLKRQIHNIENPKKQVRKHNFWQTYINTKFRISVFFKSFYDTDNRKYFFNFLKRKFRPNS